LLGAVGLALATSAGLTLYATLLFRAGRARGFLAGTAPFATGALVGTGVALGLLVMWSRDAVLRYIETVTASLALPTTLFAFVLGVLAVQAMATMLLIGHGGFADSDQRSDRVS
jgi:putative peptidoglycan lipid II flippase